jgi:tetratricopeptide (TPR) repeat protein
MILMKTLFRVLSLAVFLTAFSVLTFAQDQKPPLEELFTKFRTEIKAPCGERDPAMATGKTIIDNYGSDELNKDIIEFVKKKMAEIEKTDPDCKLTNRYNATYKAKSWSDFFAVSKEIMAKQGDSGLGTDVLLDNVSVGYNLADRDKIDTYNAQTLDYAKRALQRIETGKSQTGKWGAWEPFTTKEQAQSWLNYIVGWLMYNKLNQKTPEALTYFYKSTQVSNEKKTDSSIYINIGTYFSNEASRLYTEYLDERKANNNEDNDATRAKLALARGNSERAIDAFGRAYKIIAPDAKIKQEVKKGISDKLAELYKFRFNTADAKQADVDKFVSDLVAKPMPDPSAAVTPVVLEVKPATTTTTSNTPSTSTTTTTPSTKATTTNPTKQPTSSTTTTTPASTTTSTTKEATTVKKPVTKKKGTR